MAFLNRKNPELFTCKHPNLVTCFGKKEYLPLWEAIFDKQEDVDKVLLGLGADPDQKCPLNKQNAAGFTFLQAAATRHDFLIEHLSIAEILINRGANVNAYSHESKKNLLQLAIINGNTQCADLLLKNGAELEGSRWGDKSPGVCAFDIKDDSASIEMLHLLFKHGLNLNYRDSEGNNLLHTFIKCHSEDKTSDSVFKLSKALVDAGVPFDDQNKDGFSALHLAIHNDEYELARYFIERGADVNLKCNRGLTPMYQATEHGLEEYVELLVDHGADINEKSNGLTALHRACMGNMNWVIKVLLKKGADVSAKDFHGTTPLALLELDDHENDHSILELLKKFARLSFENLPVCESDMILIRSHPRALKVFEKCQKELLTLSNTMFYASYSYYWVLKMSKSTKKLANHMKNKEFTESCLFKSGCTQYYREDVLLIIQEACNINNDSNKIYSRLRTIFCDVLPDVVIRNLMNYLELKDLPVGDDS